MKSNSSDMKKKKLLCLLLESVARIIVKDGCDDRAVK